MKKWIFLVATLIAATGAVSAQKYFTRDAKIKFNSEASVEKIEAVNKSATVVLDTKTGAMEWKVLIKSFLFEKALMQEHFNENYLESDKYPNSTFKGTIVNLADVKFGTDGTYKVKVKGTMTMHGVSKEIEVPGVLVIAGGAVKLRADFMIKCSDYNVKIEATKLNTISNDIKIVVDATLSLLK